MERLAIGDAPGPLGRIVAAARGWVRLELTAAARARIVAARAVVEAHAHGAAPIYGLNTGLAGNLAHRLDPSALAAAQVQMVRGRNVGVGPVFPQAVARTQLLCRSIGLSRGGAGISPHVLDLMIAMFDRGVTPSIPGRGSIGASDLELCGHIGAVVIGSGLAWFDGVSMPGAAALAAAGLSPVVLGPKDGLGILNSSAVSCGHAACVLSELGDLLVSATVTAALSMEGYAANPGIFDARIAAARPAGGQVRASAMFARILAGSALHQRPPRAIQDALSFRVLSPIYGPALAAFDAAVDAVTLDINAASDNPLVLPDDGLILSTANFHTPAIALAFDSLAIALCHLATASTQRIMKLMDARLSGLPRYLSPEGGVSAGLAALQETAAALHAEIRLQATPASLDSVPVAEGVEDHAPNTPLTIAKLERQLLPLGLLVAIEALTAAQAVDLRGLPMLASATAPLYTAIRREIPMLGADRKVGPDADRVHGVIVRPELLTALRRHLAGLSLNPLVSGDDG